MTNKLLIGTAAVIAAGFAALFGGVLDRPAAAPPDALAAVAVGRGLQGRLRAQREHAPRSSRASRRRSRANTDDEHSWALLGLAYEQRARETGDPSYYAQGRRAR